MSREIFTRFALWIVAFMYKSIWWRHQMETFSAVNSPHKGQWRGALMFSLICARINGWLNNGGTGVLKRHRFHYDVTVMVSHIIEGTFAGIVAIIWYHACTNTANAFRHTNQSAVEQTGQSGKELYFHVRGLLHPETYLKAKSREVSFGCNLSLIYPNCFEIGTNHGMTNLSKRLYNRTWCHG